MRGLSPFFLPALATWRAAVGRCDAPSGLSKPGILRPSKTLRSVPVFYQSFCSKTRFSVVYCNKDEH